MHAIWICSGKNNDQPLLQSKLRDHDLIIDVLHIALRSTKQLEGVGHYEQHLNVEGRAHIPNVPKNT